MVSVRLRFVLVLVAAFAVVRNWDALQDRWEKLTRRAAPSAAAAESADTEYWCPMCPGVVSDVPGKCPVCNMALVRRHRGDMVQSAGGGPARMELSPYRVQLAGIRTAPVEYRPLVYEVITGGFVETAGPSAASVQADVYEKDLALLSEGQRVEASTEAFPGRAPFVGQVHKVVTQLTHQRPSFHVQLEIANLRQELCPGMFVNARIQVPAGRLDWVERALTGGWQDRVAAELAVRAPVPGPGLLPTAGLGGLLGQACRQALLWRGLVLAVPDSAVVDTGSRKVVYLETGPGMFDAIEVAVGPRCGEFRPVLGRLEAGQRIVTAGAFLLDAEARLNPAAATGYFGAARNPAPPAASPSPAAAPDVGASLAGLSPADRALAARQRVCPVTGERLGSMGKPVRVEVAGRVVFLCCRSCERELRSHPDQYLSKPGP